MADKVYLELVSPERLLLSTEVAMAVVPGSEGDFAVLPGHAPMISSVRPGILEVYETEDGAPMRIFVRGGFAEVGNDRLTVLAEEALEVAELDREALDAHIQDAREDLEDATTDRARAKAHGALEKLEELRRALG